jgi:ElaB/YqjD/DUF883 family membrane-anchored ribosome-binding protein
MQTTESLKRASRVTADACTSAAKASRDAMERGVGYVRRNPIKVLIGAVAVGALVAMAWQRRQTNWQDRTFRLPVKRMKNWMHAAAERAGETYEDYKARATEAAGDAMQSVQKTARGFRFWS